MCGRYAVTTDPALLAAELDAIDEVTSSASSVPESSVDSPDAPKTPLGPGGNYNVAPTSTIMSVVQRHAHGVTDDDPLLRVRAMRWGLVPFWTTVIAKRPVLFNARAESVADKASFRQSLRSRRCLIPMDGWYEWRKGAVGVGGKPIRTPFFMSPEDGTRLFMAGLWSVWRPKDAQAAGRPLMSCTIITTDAVGALRDIHDRMPLIMPTQNWDAWLDPDSTAPSTLLAPPSADVVSRIELRAVSPLVNRVTNNTPELLRPAEPTPEQGTLL